jgi:hypothetical protein
MFTVSALRRFWSLRDLLEGLRRIENGENLPRGERLQPDQVLAE